MITRCRLIYGDRVDELFRKFRFERIKNILLDDQTRVTLTDAKKDSRCQLFLEICIEMRTLMYDFAILYIIIYRYPWYKTTGL